MRKGEGEVEGGGGLKVPSICSFLKPTICQATLLHATLNVARQWGTKLLLVTTVT